MRKHSMRSVNQIKINSKYILTGKSNLPFISFSTSFYAKLVIFVYLSFQTINIIVFVFVKKNERSPMKYDEFFLFLSKLNFLNVSEGYSYLFITFVCVCFSFMEFLFINELFYIYFLLHTSYFF